MEHRQPSLDVTFSHIAVWALRITLFTGLVAALAWPAVPMFQKNIAESTALPGAPVQLALVVARPADPIASLPQVPAPVAEPEAPLPPAPGGATPDMRDARAHPRSTFAVNVNSASWVRLRQQLAAGRRPDPGSLRLEELVNAGRYADPAPVRERVALSGEVGPCPWQPQHRLVRVALKARHAAVAPRPPACLVFLVDVSGSMALPERLPLVKRALSLLLGTLRAEDRIAVVTYAGDSGVALPLTAGSETARIGGAIDGLASGGSTNGGAGIELAYRLAREGFRPGGQNRVILCTDGDLNVGVTSPAELGALIEREARSGVFLSVLGVGDSDGGDRTLETLARRGNGVHAHVDDEVEAERVLARQVDATLVTVARDVKVQVTFDPERVKAWRLLGYAERRMADAAFEDDGADACEMGSGQAVTALYEIAPRGEEGAPVLELAVRHRAPEGGPAREERLVVRADPRKDKPSTAHRLAAALAWLALALERPQLDAEELKRILDEFAIVRAEAPWLLPDRLDQVLSALPGR